MNAVILASLALAACGVAPTATATLTILPTPTTAVTLTPPPTATNTSTPLPPTETPTPAPTLPPAGAPDDALWKELQQQDYRIVTSAMTIGPEGYLYQAYLLTNPKYKSEMMGGLGSEFGTETGPGICQVLFYRWDGDHYSLLKSLGERETPIYCGAVNWDADYAPSDEAQTALGLHGLWSDINGNGLPEFAVSKWWCRFCHEYDRGSTSFYEIQSTQTVVDLAADLPGDIVEGKIFHSAEPLTIWVYTPWEALSETVMAYSIFEWQAGKYVDVSTRYASEYQAQLDDVVAALKMPPDASQPQGLPHSIQEILVLTNIGGLDRKAGLDAFLEATKGGAPDANAETRCWLQLARAHAQIDYDRGVPFEPYALLDIALAGGQPLSEQYPHLTRDIDTTRYDVSACLGE